MIQQFPIPRAFLSLSPCLSSFTLAIWHLSSTQSSSCSSSVSLFCPNPFHHAPPQVLGIPNHIPSQSNQAFYQTIYRSRSTATLSLIQAILNIPQNGRCFFIFTTLLLRKTTPSISTKNLFLYFSQFLPSYTTLNCLQNHSYNLH